MLNLCVQHLNAVLESVHRLYQADPAIRWVLTQVRPKPVSEPTLRGRSAAKARQRVYFMEREGLVKIGISSNVEKRVQEVSRGSSMVAGMTVGPVRLLGTRPGGREEETRLHRMFSASNVGGEWFRLSEEQMRVVRRLCK